MIKKIITLFLILIPINSYALIEVDITRGNLDPLPVAVSPLSIDEKSRKSFEKALKKKNIGEEISSIVEKNLSTSGLFNPLSKDAFLQANLFSRFFIVISGPLANLLLGILLIMGLYFFNGRYVSPPIINDFVYVCVSVSSHPFSFHNK